MIKIKGLTRDNTAALREVLTEEIVDGSVQVAATTATFHMDDPAELLRTRMADLPGRGHPRASLHAVVRKLDAKEGQA